MKKICSIILCIVLSMGVIGCNKSDDIKTNDTKPKVEENSNEKTVDGMKFTITKVSKEAPVGDTDENGGYKENGEYFTVGMENKKVADYDYVVVDIKVENTTDEAVKLFQTGWYAQAEDGYEFENIKVTDKLDNQQVPSKYSFEAKVKIPVEKALKLTKINVKYNLKDYSDLGAAMEELNNGMSKDDIKKKYPHLYVDNFIEFNNLQIK